MVSNKKAKDIRKILRDNNMLPVLEKYKKLDRKYIEFLNTPLGKLSSKEIINLDKKTDDYLEKISKEYTKLMRILKKNKISARDANSYLTSLNKKYRKF